MNTLAALVSLIIIALDVLKWTFIIQGILSLLMAFNVVSPRQPAVRQIAYGLERFTDPFLRPIRRALPAMGGVDFSPMVAILLIIGVQMLIPAILADAGIFGGAPA